MWLERSLRTRHQGADGRVAGERDISGDRLVDRQRERIDVGSRADPLTPRLFRRGISGRADHGTVLVGPARLRDGAGKTEVGDAQPAGIVEEEIGRLDVAVYELLAVGVIETAGRLESDQQGL